MTTTSLCGLPRVRVLTRIAMVSAVVAVAILAAISPTARAEAVMQPIATVSEGEATTIVVSGCADTTRYAGMTLGIAGVDDRGGEWIEMVPLAPRATEHRLFRPAGRYRAELTCVGYNGEASSTAAHSFVVMPADNAAGGDGSGGNGSGGDDGVLGTPVAPPLGDDPASDPQPPVLGTPVAPPDDTGAMAPPVGQPVVDHATGAIGLPSTGC